MASARQSFCVQFASELHSALLTVWNGFSSVSYTYKQTDVNARRCKNVVLGHLARTADGEALIEKQFAEADNMTDSLGALRAAQSGGAEVFNRLMTAFEQKWNHDPLVLDKWFALNATSEREDILAHITMLKSHPQFTMGNPNRVRALIGSFAFYNPVGFHQPDGSGYRYVTDYLLELDQHNPQVAARIVTPLTQWQNYADKHQQKMKAQLTRLVNHEGLSKDVFEKVSKSLAYEKSE